MGAMSLWHWIIVLAVVLLLFGGGRIAGVMGDLGKGIKSFKKELREENEAAASGTVRQDPAKLTPPQAQQSSATTENSAG